MPWRWRRRLRHPGRPRVKKLRLLLILFGLGILAVISTVFGMMMAVASDLPQIENRQQYQAAANSYLYDDHGRLIGQFAPPNHEVIDTYDRLGAPNCSATKSCWVQDAIVSVEDRRFWSDPGVDLRGIARAVVSDVTGGSTSGRLDDRPAVRQERPGRAGQPDDLREAARGGPRLPPHPQVEEVEDHHRVPELDLLRKRRLRGRIGRAGVLRQGPWLRRGRPGRSEQLGLRGCSPALVRVEVDPTRSCVAGRHGR